MKKNILFAFTILILSFCVSPPEYSDGLLENIPAIVDESDYFSISIFGEKLTQEYEWQMSLSLTDSDILVQTLAVKDIASTPDSTFLYIVDAMNDTIKIFSILNELNWVSEDSVSNFGTPDKIVFSGKNFTGRLEYQLLIKN